MTRIAICVRGSIRTWEKCKFNIFNSLAFDESCEVDWFFDTWDLDRYTWRRYSGMVKLDEKPVTTLVSPAIVESIKQDFRNYNKNLASINIHQSNTSLPPHKSFLKLIYLSNLSKRRYEHTNNFRYDCVVQIRPDAVYGSYGSSIIKVGTQRSEFMQNIVNYNTVNHKILSRITSDVVVNFEGKSLTADQPHGLPQVEDQVFFGANSVIDMLSDLYMSLTDSEDNMLMPHITHAWYLQRYGVLISNLGASRIIRDMVVDDVYDYSTISNDFFSNIDSPALQEILKQTEQCWYSHQLIHLKETK